MVLHDSVGWLAHLDGQVVCQLDDQRDLVRQEAPKDAALVQQGDRLSRELAIQAAAGRQTHKHQQPRIQRMAVGCQDLCKELEHLAVNLFQGDERSGSGPWCCSGCTFGLCRVQGRKGLFMYHHQEVHIHRGACMADRDLGCGRWGITKVRSSTIDLVQQQHSG